MDEKRDIEHTTAKAFLRLYNATMGASYEIIDHSDAPDFVCREKSGRELKLEITLTQDRPGDIKAFLGRSESRSPEELKRHLEAVSRGEENIFDRVSCLQSNVLEMLKGIIQKKLYKDYGPNTALVICNTSPIDWNWNHILEQLHAFLNSNPNPYDKGIWIVSCGKDRVFQVS